MPVPPSTWRSQGVGAASRDRDSLGKCRSYEALPPVLPEPRSDRFHEVAHRNEVTLIVHRDRQLWQRPGGRPEDRAGAVVDVELRLVAGAEDAAGLLLVQRHRAADMGADLGVGDVLAVAEVGLPRARLG